MARPSSANPTLDLRRVKDVVAGTWSNNPSQPGPGSWSVNGTSIQGISMAGSQPNSADFYLDINRNGRLDSIDIKVGRGQLLSADPAAPASGTWNWSPSARMGDLLSSGGQDLGQIVITNGTFLKPGVKWDAVLGSLDVSRFTDVISGIWSDDAQVPGSGSWRIDGRPDIVGLFKASSSSSSSSNASANASANGRSADLYLDVNRNGSVDALDQKVGSGQIHPDAVTGGSGTWNWSARAKSGDIFTNAGHDAGRFTLTDTKFLAPGVKWDAVLGSLDTSRFRDVVTGTWSDTEDQSLKLLTVNGKSINLLARINGDSSTASILLDANGNKQIDSNEKKVGTVTVGMDPGNQGGTWSWSSTARIGDIFNGSGFDVGSLRLTDRAFLNSLTTHGSHVH